MASLVLTGDTSGQVTIAAPAVAGTTTLTLPATTGTVLNDATVGVCRAWVNFNGIGTVAIRASFNVSSITDNGTGDYTVNFTTAMSDANYSTQIAHGYNGTGADFLSDLVEFSGASDKTTSKTRVKLLNFAGSALTDVSDVMIAIFR